MASDFVTKSLERYYSSTSSASQGVFDSADYLARKGSDIKTYFEDKKQLEEEQRKAEEEQKKTDEEDKEQVNSTDSSKEQDAYTSRLKTNENIEENSETPSQESTSRIKTNVNIFQLKINLSKPFRINITLYLKNIVSNQLN